MPKTVIHISSSPLAEAIRRAVEFAYHDERGLSVSFVLSNGPGTEPIAFEAEAVIRFSEENGLSGTVTPKGESSQPLFVELPKDGGQVLFHIGD